MTHLKMNWRQPGYVHDRHRIIDAMHRGQDKKMTDGLPGAAHYFIIFTMGLDLCAKCRKPRSEHPRAPR